VTGQSGAVVVPEGVEAQRVERLAIASPKEHESVFCV